MKRLILFALLIISLTGCSALQDLLPAQQATQPPAPPTDTLVVLPSELPTSTPNLFDIATLTPSPSPIFPTDTPAFTNTATPRPTITLEFINPLFSTPSNPMFSIIQKSGNQIMWNLCEPSSIKFKVVVTNLKVKNVLMFMKLQDKFSGNGTQWGGGAIMNSNKQGTYSYTLTKENINHYRDFEDAWLQYQFVATTANYLTVLGRSQVFRSDVSVTHCPKTPKP